MIQSTPGVRRHPEKWLRMLRTAATVIFSVLWVVLPARAVQSSRRRSRTPNLRRL